LKPLHDQSLARSGAVCCDVAADAVVRLSLESLPELRRQPGPVVGEPLPASFLKHADEQTVAGLAAVYQAIGRANLETVCFRDWGVVAAPRFLGRPAMATALQRFAAEGAWGVSPHLIPHRSLHSISGTVSQALKIHGPNFGVGGGPRGASEVMLAAAALLQGQRLPGVWVILTCLDPELPPDEGGRATPGTQAVGLALALTPAPLTLPSPPAGGEGRVRGGGGTRLRLRLVCGAPDSQGPAPSCRNGAGFDLLRLETLLHVLHTPCGGETTIVQLLEPGCRLELSSPPSTVCPPLSAQEITEWRMATDNGWQTAESGRRTAETLL
jgi:hypothetical protein